MFDEEEREQLEQLVQSRVEEDKERLERALENEKRYRRMVTLGKIALARGMRLCTIDCTDGVYISKLNDVDEMHENSQGARRRLLSEISKNRAEEVGTNP